MEKMLEFFIKEYGEDHWCVKDLKKAMKRINEENSVTEKQKVVQKIFCAGPTSSITFELQVPGIHRPRLDSALCNSATKNNAL